MRSETARTFYHVCLYGVLLWCVVAAAASLGASIKMQLEGLHESGFVLATLSLIGVVAALLFWQTAQVFQNIYKQRCEDLSCGTTSDQRLVSIDNWSGVTSKVLDSIVAGQVELGRCLSERIYAHRNETSALHRDVKDLATKIDNYIAAQTVPAEVKNDGEKVFLVFCYDAGDGNLYLSATFNNRETAEQVAQEMMRDQPYAAPAQRKYWTVEERFVYGNKYSWENEGY